MNVRGSLSVEEIDEFLTTHDVPVRLACRTPSGHLWMLSLWYRYREDRTLECATSASATVVDYLTHDPTDASPESEGEGEGGDEGEGEGEGESEVAFEISTNRPPYGGVRGRGTASVAPDPEKETLRALLERYLDGTESELAQNLLREEREEVTIAIEPAVVYGWDYSGRMGEASEQ
ncbi:hypothetical protein [Halobiforma nitratireducens]|uniref:Pyridoxamine 5'-phosphate oxidase-like FMN-binding protein n=1 Tax=Halobiforma nitratireducens JCM 10879 TaxID=1227454 RepID=M0M3R0_9EURY|nr:hypothetical protein [Halobiforma nitratireducens]EMA40023.1 hypothetical protein C446_07629 [Halobiforma nitratireducens JCM 10879]